MCNRSGWQILGLKWKKQWSQFNWKEYFGMTESIKRVFLQFVVSGCIPKQSLQRDTSFSTLLFSVSVHFCPFFYFFKFIGCMLVHILFVWNIMQDWNRVQQEWVLNTGNRLTFLNFWFHRPKINAFLDKCLKHSLRLTQAQDIFTSYFMK